MTVDVHLVCQGALNNYNSVSAQLDAMMSTYHRDLDEFRDDLRDVLEVCGAAELTLEDLSIDGKFIEELYNNPIADTIAIPRFWHELLEALVAKAGLGFGCLFELAGALQSESTFRRTEEDVNGLRQTLELFGRQYVGCLRKAGFQKSRRDGTLGPPL